MYKVGQTIKYKITIGEHAGKIVSGNISETIFLSNKDIVVIERNNQRYLVNKKNIVNGNVNNTVINIINSTYKNG